MTLDQIKFYISLLKSKMKCHFPLFKSSPVQLSNILIKSKLGVECIDKKYNS